MPKLLNILLFLFISSSNIYSQSLTQNKANEFTKLLISDSPLLESSILDTELLLSKRLNINYKDELNKFLISYNFSPEIITKISTDKFQYSLEIKNLEEDYSSLQITIPNLNESKEFIFYKSKLISKPYYYGRNWETIESKYFVFHISNKELTNNLAISSMDNFVDETLLSFKFTHEEIEHLQNEKIHYYLCRDEEEIEKLTGYKARGMYYIPCDYIISTYNSHYHEVVHLLTNYKLKTVQLYTLPFLQEGIAVAYGGRGGKSKNVIMDMAKFLAESNFMDYKSLLGKKSFYKHNASMSYPVSGLYTNFLIEELGIENFLKLYKKYSHSPTLIESAKISTNELPNEKLWKSFLSKDELKNKISLTEVDVKNFPEIIIENDSIILRSNEDRYLFMLRNKIRIKNNIRIDNFTSKLFNEILPDEVYKNEKYLLTVTENEISVYNLLTNSLIAKYVSGFTLNNQQVKKLDGYYIYSIKKDVFDEDLVETSIL